MIGAAACPNPMEGHLSHQGGALARVQLSNYHIAGERGVVEHFLNPARGRRHDRQPIRPSPKIIKPRDFTGGIYPAYDFDALAREFRHQRPSVPHVPFYDAGTQRVVNPSPGRGLSGWVQYPKRFCHAIRHFFIGTVSDLWRNRQADSFTQILDGGVTAGV